ncbi:AAA family ATPase [Nocardiopsis changdeensis]|uniref:MinD/ParA family protein n=1 Tax=Nocardiopsis changdeensis TaxID=2831969 RepID=A0A975KTD5_9ACTN|nr:MULTISPECIES: MinD/ParA family protein [Nocardiopsis]QUX26428.1 MinD/ParA family protein [Nocardiopsis changdeensis]QYX40700.1 MinD/ParA family protein [Nocardiopsis sp. MT53]
MTSRGPNSDMPSAADLHRRDPTLTLSTHAEAGVRTGDQAPPRRPAPPAPEPEDARAEADADDTSEATVRLGPAAPERPQAPTPPSAVRPWAGDTAAPVAAPAAPSASAAPSPWAASAAALPPAPAAVPHADTPAWGPGPNAQSSVPGAGTGPDLSFLAPRTAEAAAPQPETVPGDPNSLAFVRGEAPAPAEPPRAETSADLTTDRLAITHTAPVPTSPLRRVWNRITGRQAPQVESETEAWRRAMRAGATTRTLRPQRIAVLCIKGGVGKTTVTFLLGSMLASLRGDRVIAVDANTDQGTLAGKLRTQTSKTIQDLLRKEEVRGYYDVRELTSQAPTGLEVLASNEDPGVTAALTAADYGQVIKYLDPSYSVILSDCGTGILHDVIRGEDGVLPHTGRLVIVSNTSVNGAKKAAETMDWLEKNGYRDLVRNSIVVINMVREGSQNQLDLAQMRAHFTSRAHAVVEIPLDPHLVQDGIIDMDALDVRTQDAVLHLAYLVGKEFSREEDSETSEGGSE